MGFSMSSLLSRHSTQYYHHRHGGGHGVCIIIITSLLPGGGSRACVVPFLECCFLSCFASLFETFSASTCFCCGLGMTRAWCVFHVLFYTHFKRFFFQIILKIFCIFKKWKKKFFFSSFFSSFFSFFFSIYFIILNLILNWGCLKHSSVHGIWPWPSPHFCGFFVAFFLLRLLTLLRFFSSCTSQPLSNFISLCFSSSHQMVVPFRCRCWARTIPTTNTPWRTMRSTRPSPSSRPLRTRRRRSTTTASEWRSRVWLGSLPSRAISFPWSVRGYASKSAHFKNRYFPSINQSTVEQHGRAQTLRHCLVVFFMCENSNENFWTVWPSDLRLNVCVSVCECESVCVCVFRSAWWRGASCITAGWLLSTCSLPFSCGWFRRRGVSAWSCRRCILCTRKCCWLHSSSFPSIFSRNLTLWRRKHTSISNRLAFNEVLIR